MMASLRHLRIVLAVADTRSVTRAAGLCHVSQPAVTAALAKLEAGLGQPLFDRRTQGLALTEAGEVLVLRVRRALALLDPALQDVAPRLRVTVTMAQLTALIALVEAETFSAAARRLGVAQPTVHRAISQMEDEVGRSLFDRTPHGVMATKAVLALATAARLAFAELEQAGAEVAELAGRDVGRIVIGAMPLSRSVLIGPAIAAFRSRRRTMAIRVVEGPYAELVLGLRRGDVDLLVGALRPTVEDLDQVALFEDEMTIVARIGHPLCQGQGASLADLAAASWVVAPEGTPARQYFDAMFQVGGQAGPTSLVETGSLVLMRDLLERTDHLGFVSALQVAGDVAAGRLARVGYQPQGTSRPIGLTTRKGWRPTKAQSEMIAALQDAARAAT